MLILVMKMVFPSYLLIMECTSTLHSSPSPEALPTLYMSGTQLHARDSEGNQISALWLGVPTTQCLLGFPVDLSVAATDLYRNLWKAVDQLPRNRCSHI